MRFGRALSDREKGARPRTENISCMHKESSTASKSGMQPHSYQEAGLT